MGSPGIGPFEPVPGVFLPDNKTRRTLRLPIAAGAPCQKTAIPSLRFAQHEAGAAAYRPATQATAHRCTPKKKVCVQRFSSRLKGGPVNADHIAGPTEVPPLAAERCGFAVAYDFTYPTPP